MRIIETDRLNLRQLSTGDADFILDLLTQPSFIKYIGDRGVRNVADARTYIEDKFLATHERLGFGMYLVEMKEDRTAIGICGFVKRETLPDADIGFAFLPRYWSQGYAFESASAVLDYGKDVLGFRRILAITTKDNESSARLLAKIGFKHERIIKLAEGTDEVNLFAHGAW